MSLDLSAGSEDPAPAIPGAVTRPGPRPRLLFLGQTLPFPPDGGVSIRTYHVLRALAHRFDVHALCFYRISDRPTRGDVSAAIAGLAPFARVEAFPIPQESHRSRLLWDHACSVLRGRAYTVFAYASRPYRARLRELLRATPFDLVHMDSLDLSGYLPQLGDLPVVCVHHNIESVLLRRRAATEGVGWRRAYVAHQASLVEREERHWSRKVALNVVVSPADQVVLEQLAPQALSAVVPNGVDLEYFRPHSGAVPRVVGIGGINWFPNRDALDYFCATILPIVRARGDIAVRWVGRASPEEQRQRLTQDRVELTGYVEDVRPHVSDAACVVVPLRVGGGTRLKILAAWAMGRAVVSTSVGCEGLAAVDGRNILIRDAPAEFASAVWEVMADRALRERLGREGRSTVEEHYSWDAIGSAMLDRYLAVTGRG